MKPKFALKMETPITYKPRIHFHDYGQAIAFDADPNGMWVNREHLHVARQDLANYEGAVSAVLKRYQDARCFKNPHTRQVAREIEGELNRLLDDARKGAL